MGNAIEPENENGNAVNASGYSNDVTHYFAKLPDIAAPLMRGAKQAMKQVENMLYNAPGFINLIRSMVPQEMLQAVLTDEQKAQLSEVTLKLMTKKDGSLLATLVDPKSNRIIAEVPLKSVEMAPQLSQAMANFSSQMQMAQIVEEIQTLQLAIGDIRQGQESDRLAMAYSCQQKYLQAMQIRNPQLKSMALWQIASDAEDSRNLLMLSQKANLHFIKAQPQSSFGKFLNGAKPDEIKLRMSEIRESLTALNTVSMVEAMAYQELDETDAAHQSLKYYADYLQDAYLTEEDLTLRLDQLDPLPDNHWSEALPRIKDMIQALPCGGEVLLLEGENDQDEDM